MTVGLILVLVVLAAANALTGFYIYKLRKQVTQEQLNTTNKQKELDDYVSKCYCKEILP